MRTDGARDGMIDDDLDPEPVNVLEFLEGFGLSRNDACNVILHLVLTRTYVFPTDAREAAAELGFHIPFVHPGDGRMH